MTLQLTGRLADPDRTELADACPIDRASAVLARRSTILLLREASFGTARYDDFVTRTGLTESVTAAQLRTLVAEGLLAKRPYQEQGQRRRYEYVLTEAGNDLVPVLLALAAWGDKHRPEPHRLTLRHAGCDRSLHVELHCEAGHRVDEDDVALALEGRRAPTTR